MILNIYFCKTIVRFQILALAILATIFLLLDLIERLNDVGTGSFSAFNAIQVTALNAPYLIFDLLPSTFLIGSVIAISSLIQSNELMVARTAGFTKFNLVVPLLVSCLTISIFCFFVYQFVIPTMQIKAHKISTKTITGTAINSEQIWIKRKNEILTINNISNHTQPQLIEIFTLDKKGKIRNIIRAEKAFISEKNQWLLFNVDKIIVDSKDMKKVRNETLIWQGFINQNEYARLTIPPQALSISALIRYLSKTELVSVGQNLFRSELWKKLSLPITLIGMSLIALPIAGSASSTQQHSRSNLLAGLCAMLFFILHQTVSNFDKILGWPSSLSWTLPPFLIIFISLILIKKSRF